MLLKDFKSYWIAISALLFLAYFIMSFFVIGYEERTNRTELAAVLYEVMGYIVFSLNFWNKIFPNIFQLIFSILTTSVLLTLISLGVKQMFRLIFKIK